MAKKDQNSDHHPHQGVLDHRRDFYGYPAGLPHGFEQYYSADFQAQVISFTTIIIPRYSKVSSWLQRNFKVAATAAVVGSNHFPVPPVGAGNPYSPYNHIYQVFIIIIFLHVLTYNNFSNHNNTKYF